jgi:hypothetical protein
MTVKYTSIFHSKDLQNFGLKTNHLATLIRGRVAGCPFFIPKTTILVYFGRIGIEKCEICNDNLVYFVIIFFISRQFGSFYGQLLYFRHFGIFFKKNLATLMSVGIIKVDSS